MGLLDSLWLKDGRRIRFYRSMANSCKSGLSPLRALDILAGDAFMAPIARAIHERVRAGGAFSEGMRLRPDFFPPWQVEIVAVGESTGRLDASFRSVADVIEERRGFLLSLAPGLLYPLGLLHFAPLCLYGGKLGPFLVGAGSWRDLVSFAVSASRFLLAFYLPAAALYVGGGRLIERHPAPARLPLVGSFYKAQFCFYLSALVRAGASIHRGIAAAAQASGLGPSALRAAAAASDGMSATDMLRLLDVFSTEELGQIETGETAGALDAELQNIAEQSKLAWQSALKMLSAAVPPMIYIMVAAAVGYQIISFWRGYYGTLEQLMH